MSIAGSLIELVLTRHHLKSSRVHILEALGALAGLVGVMMFAASALALLLFAGLWLGYRVMVVSGLSDLSAVLFVCVGIILIAVVVVWALNHLRRTLMQAFNDLLRSATTVPGQQALSGALSGTAKVAGAFRQGLMRSDKRASKRARHEGEPHPAAKA